MNVAHWGYLRSLLAGEITRLASLQQMRHATPAEVELYQLQQQLCSDLMVSANLGTLPERNVSQQNLADAWAALSAMRDSINEHIPLPSPESDLLRGPEVSVSCSVIAEAVVGAVIGYKERIRLADELIKSLQDHEGAEGWSAELYTKLSTYDTRYWLNEPVPQSPTGVAPG